VKYELGFCIPEDDILHKTVGLGISEIGFHSVVFILVCKLKANKYRLPEVDSAGKGTELFCSQRRYTETFSF
jgi:hypothetical protein